MSAVGSLSSSLVRSASIPRTIAVRPAAKPVAGLPRTRSAQSVAHNAITPAPERTPSYGGFSIWQALKAMAGTWIIVNARQASAASLGTVAGNSLASRELTPDTVSAPCPRYAAGSVVQDPVSISSSQGLLQLDLAYQYGIDNNNVSKFCFVADDGSVAPLLRMAPGDQVVVNLGNQLPGANQTNSTYPSEMAVPEGKQCGGTTMDTSSVNIHWHGLTVAPSCRADEVIHTIVNNGDNFTYAFGVPADQSPGAYWYHPHIHGISELALQGGASGPIIVDGIETMQPAVQNLPERVFVLRDMFLPEQVEDSTDAPAWDISINYVPINYPDYKPAIIEMKPNERQFWRVVNAAAGAIFDLQVVYDGKPQPLQVVARDGYVTRSNGTNAQAQIQTVNDILLSPAGRVEFIIDVPDASVQNATLQTLTVDTGPDGDIDPQRPIASIRVDAHTAAPNVTLPQAPSVIAPLPLPNLANAKPSITRKLGFNESAVDPTDPDSDTNFFITVDGQTPTLFDANNPPAINVTQDTIEDWIVENQSGENHEFHQHQIHFMQMEANGQSVPSSQQQLIDTINVPYWNGTGDFPSVKLRMDFRGMDVGQYVYHCHILEHEDKGMMAIIQVNPSAPPTGANNASSAASLGARGSIAGVGAGVAAVLASHWLLYNNMLVDTVSFGARLCSPLCSRSPRTFRL